MVNKQYNVQGLNKKSKHKQSNRTSSSLSPSDAKRAGVTVLSSVANQQHTPHSYDINGSRTVSSFFKNLHHHRAPLDQSASLDETYDQNISLNANFDILYNNCFDGDINHENSTRDTDKRKELTINDIERFQYIVQMDREMVNMCNELFETQNG